MADTAGQLNALIDCVVMASTAVVYTHMPENDLLRIAAGRVSLAHLTTQDYTLQLLAMWWSMIVVGAVVSTVPLTCGFGYNSLVRVCHWPARCWPCPVT